MLFENGTESLLGPKAKKFIFLVLSFLNCKVGVMILQDISAVKYEKDKNQEKYN